MAKDLFSNQSDLYARYRPTYPQELYDYILSFVKEKNTAWDCATGNGQAAVVLAEHFKKVVASDISAAQIEKATAKENIEYLICPAEETPFKENAFDLITVAQAYHWIKWKAFKKEVARVGKPGSIIAIWTYYNPKSDDHEVNRVFDFFYKEVTHSYWDLERKYVEEKYATVEFDYELLPEKKFETNLNWDRGQFIGYVSTWSAVQKFIKVNGHSPVPELEKEISKFWDGHEIKKVVFPVYLKLGRIVK